MGPRLRVSPISPSCLIHLRLLVGDSGLTGGPPPARSALWREDCRGMPASGAPFIFIEGIGARHAFLLYSPSKEIGEMDLWH